MTADLNLTWQETDARGRQVDVLSSRIELDLSNAASDALTFLSTTTVEFTSSADRTWLDLVADDIVELVVNGERRDPEYDGARLLLHDLKDGDGEKNVVTVSAHCRYSRVGEGMHRFRDPQDGQTYLYTHCEPTDARRMYACFEQPDLKTRFTVQMTVPNGWVARSNQPLARRDGDTHTFAPTPLLSSYILAMAAGPYHVVEDSWSVERADGTSQTIPLTLLCRRGMAEHLEAEEILEITKAGLDFYDREFGFPYPWGKYDQIFVPEYNLGAMENPGLVTFTESYLFRGGATVTDRTGRAEVILHEMAHMWFGDLVTPKWWDDLWLKESFADLMGYQVSQEGTRFDQAWLQFALGRKNFAYRFDQMPTTHPVVARIDDLEAARQNFDGITYAKGASVLRQLQEFIGRDAFFAGARDYFQEHQFSSAQFRDLLAALSKHTEHDLDEWAQLWLHTTLPSRLVVDLVREGDTVTSAVLKQSSENDIVRPHRLRVAGYSVSGSGLQKVLDAPVTLLGESVEIPEAAGKEIDLLLPNSGELTYAISRLDEHSRATAEQHLSAIDDDLVRGGVWGALWNQTRDGVIPAGDFVRTFRAQAPSEPNAMILDIVGNQVKVAIGAYLPAAQREQAWEAVAVTARDAMRAAEADTDLQRTWANLFADLAAHAPSVADDALALAGGEAPEGLDVTAQLRWKLTASLVHLGRWNEQDVQRTLASDDTLIGRTSSLTALAASAGTQRATWDRLLTDDSMSNDEQRALLVGFDLSGPGTSFAQEYAAMLDTVWTGRAQTMAQRLVSGLFPQVDDDADGHAAVEAVQGWLDANPGAPNALRRVVIEAVDGARRALRAQAASA